jgi:hypothetical protein
MADPPDVGPSAARREVEQRLGACLLRLQAYELTLKHLLTHAELSGPVEELEAARGARAAEIGRKTLGQLVGQLTGSVLVDAGPVLSDEDPAPEPEERGPERTGGAWFSFRIQIDLTSDDFERIESGLKAMVALRNRLVHHFLADHDLRSEAGCHAALAHLAEARDAIERHVTEVSGWVKGQEETRRLIATSPELRNYVVNGIKPDGTVDWPIAGIVGDLLEAAEALAVEGWTRLDRAVEWIAARAPDQTPARYGCRSWPQVLHESRVFDLTYVEVDGDEVAHYRERPTTRH